MSNNKLVVVVGVVAALAVPVLFVTLVVAGFFAIQKVAGVKPPVTQGT